MTTEKNIPSTATLDNMLKVIKDGFATKASLTPIETKASTAFHAVDISGNKINFYADTEKSGGATASVDLPVDMVLDQEKTTMVAKFKWSDSAYPGSTNPSLDGKPVLVMAVKGDGDSVKYSFLDMHDLIDIYTAKDEGKDKTTEISIDGYVIDVKVKVSEDHDNQLQVKDDGLYVPKPEAQDVSGKADKVSSPTDGNLVAMDANGNLTNSGKKPADFVQAVEGSTLMTAEQAKKLEKALTDDDIHEYSEAEIKKKLGLTD